VVLRSLAQSGAIYFQDEASQLVAQLVEAQAKDFVLDLCAAPGGKSTLIADRQCQSRVLACDVSARRLAVIARAVAVQQLKNVWLFLLDGSKALPFQPSSFDRVLVDAPCSGTGTLRHNPEIRWRLAETDIGRLATQQVVLLQNAAEVLKPGGRLIYSTCSVEREENEDVVVQFLRRNDQMQPVPLQGNRDLSTSSGTLRTWPQRHGTDGFFVAAFKKI
jgi:16S rRNA (cytosine967-C5)-methyltransferase